MTDRSAIRSIIPDARRSLSCLPEITCATDQMSGGLALQPITEGVQPLLSSYGKVEPSLVLVRRLAFPDPGQ